MITDFLKSEYDVAIYHSKALKAAAVQLSQVPETGAGETNHGINDICCSIYNETPDILQSYYNAAERDADRIKSVADTLLGLDLDMRNVLSNR